MIAELDNAVERTALVVRNGTFDYVSTCDDCPTKVAIYDPYGTCATVRCTACSGQPSPIAGDLVPLWRGHLTSKTFVIQQPRTKACSASIDIGRLGAESTLALHGRKDGYHSGPRFRRNRTRSAEAQRSHRGGAE